MSSRMFREALSLESNAPEVTGNPVENALALESACLEIAEADHQVQLMEYQQEELEHAHASLESIAVSLEGLVANDERGLDRVAAEGYQHAIKAIVGDALPNPVASLESFGGETECAEATQVSLEGIKDTVRKIWEAIKRAVSNAIKATADFFAKLFNGVGRMEKRIEDLMKELETAKKDKHTAKDGMFKVPGADRLEMDGKITESALKSGMTYVNGGVLETAGKIQDSATSIYKEISDFYKKADKSDEMVAVKKKVSTEIGSSKTKTIGAMGPGGKTIITTDESDDEGTSLSTVKVADHPKAKNFDGKAEIKTPSLSMVEEMLKSAKTGVDYLLKAKKDREALKKTREGVMDDAEKWAKDAEKGKLGEAWTQAKVNGALRMAQYNLFSNLGRIDSYVFGYNRALVAAAAAALGQYEAPKKD